MSEELIENLVYAAALSVRGTNRYALRALGWAASKLCKRYGVPEWRRALSEIEARRTTDLLESMRAEASLLPHGARSSWGQA